MPRTAEQLARDFADETDITMADALRHDPEVAWQAITTLSQTHLSDLQTASLAAGPLEDLLRAHGATFIDRVEREARVHAKFRHLLGGVWPSSIDRHIWDRVSKIRGTPW